MRDVFLDNERGNRTAQRQPGSVHPTARDRVLSDTELKLVWAALGDDDFGRILKLLTLTGQRESEIGELKWGEVAGGSIVLPPARTKNGHPHFGHSLSLTNVRFTPKSRHMQCSKQSLFDHLFGGDT
jgi:integrase